MKDLNTKYKDKVFEGATFPDKPYRSDVKILLNDSIKTKYLPALDKAIPGATKGLKLLLTIMAHKEGFYPGTRSYVNNNPGNIGNTDSGANRKLASLEDGIKLQKSYIEDIINGKSKAYPMGQEKYIAPFYSKEIANNPQYGLPANLPGYKFIFTGQLDQFVKIYSTGARAGNSYINTIVSYFKANGYIISPESKIQDIIKLN